MAFQKPSSKAPAQASSPASEDTSASKAPLKYAPPKEVKPTKSLMMKSKGAEKGISLCNLFTEKTKKGEEYFSGVHKESNTRFCIFPDSKNPGKYNLCTKEKDLKGKTTYPKVAVLEEKVAKSGETYLTGFDKDGDQFMCFKYQPKKK